MVYGEVCEQGYFADDGQRLYSPFFQEAVKKDGQPYPPNSLYQITVSLQRQLRENGRPEVSFFDERNPAYTTLHRSLDARMKQLTSEGIGTETISAEPVSADMEAVFREKGIFSDGLLNAVCFYNCKFFGLRDPVTFVWNSIVLQMMGLVNTLTQ